MHRSLWRALAVTGLGLALGSGCVVDNRPSEGDLTFTWLFAGEDCGPAGVASVGIQIFDVDGNVVTDDTRACSAEGVTYTGFNVGDYSFTLTGFSAGGAPLYQGSGPFAVHRGSNQYDVNLALAQ
jgi:hypothetical protein